jgi:hypothetical protein
MAYKFQKGLSLISGTLAPRDSAADLGLSGKQYNDLYIDGIAYIDQLGTDGDPSTIYGSGGELDNCVIGGETPAAITATTLTATTFKMPVNTAGYLLVGDASDYEEVALSGDATLASGGALTIGNLAVTTAKIADDAVSLAKMAALTRASIIIGDASGNPSALAKGAASTFLQSDGTDTAYVALSGDATLSAGAITIADNAVSLAKMAGIVRGKLIVGDSSGNPLYLAAGSGGKLLSANSDGDPSWNTVSGDVTLTGAGSINIGNTKVTDAMINDDVATGLAGVGLGAGSGVMTLEFSELSQLASGDIELGEDWFAIMENDGTVSKRITMVDYATKIAGAGITATNGVLSSDASPTPTSHGDAAATLVEGMNWSSAVFSAARTWTLPASPDAGDTVSVKAPTNATTFALTVSKAGSQTIDGSTTVVLAASNAAVDFVYVGSDKWLIK